MSDKTEQKSKLAAAVLQVMKAVKAVDKGMEVGSGRNAYKGVADHTVKEVMREAMMKAGLVLMPIGIEPKIQIDRWEEPDYQGNVRTRQSVMTEVKSTYLLMHESGESMEVVGYGHGVDPQDKGAGKATTYALKNLLLYLFLIPTKAIDDADTTHSDDHPTPKAAPKPKPIDPHEANKMEDEIVNLYNEVEKELPTKERGAIDKAIIEQNYARYPGILSYLKNFKATQTPIEDGK